MRASLRLKMPIWLAAAAVCICPGAANTSAQRATPTIKRTSESASELRIVAANVQMLLTASNGKETGYDPKSRKTLRAIADSDYYEDALLAFDSGRVDPNTTQAIDVRQPVQGTYRLLVSSGTAADGEEYEILIHLYRNDGSEAPIVRLSGTAKQNAPTVFEFELKGSPPRSALLRPPPDKPGR